MAVPFVVDALYGIYVLRTIFSKDEQFGADLLTEKVVEEKQYNNRVPQILTQTSMSKKVFTKGWKFNLFNQQFKVGQ